MTALPDLRGLSAKRPHVRLAGPRARRMPVSRRIGRAITQWLFDGSLIVVFVAAAGSLGTGAIAGVDVPSLVVIVVSAGALAVYQLERNHLPTECDRINQPDRCDWSVKHLKVLRACTALSALAAGTATMLLSLRSIWFVAVLATLVTLYLTLRQRSSGNPTHAYLKVGVAATAWAIAVATLPLIEAGVEAVEVLQLTLYRFGYFLPAILLPDVVDIQGDRATGRATLATTYGNGRVHQVITCSVIGVTVAGAGLSSQAPPILLTIDMIGLWLLAIFLLAGYGQNEYFLRCGVDILAAWPIITCVAAALW